MTTQQIETAVRKQLPGKKDPNRFLHGSFYSTYGTYYASDSAQSTAAIIIFCGLCRVYIPDAAKKVVANYDITTKEFNHYASLFNKHCERVATIIRCYAVNVTAPDAYKKFALAFWHQHNPTTAGEVGKSGVILSHVLSSKKEYKHFLRKEDSCLNESDFVAFYVFNKAQLVKNYLTIGIKSREFVDLLEFGY